MKISLEGFIILFLYFHNFFKDLCSIKLSLMIKGLFVEEIDDNRLISIN